MVQNWLRRALTALVVTLAAAGSFGQSGEWKAYLLPDDVRAGEQAQLIIEGQLSEDAYIYTADPDAEWIPYELTFEEGQAAVRTGDNVEPTPTIKVDKGFKADIGTHQGAVRLAIPIQFDPGATSGTLSADLMVQICDLSSCTPPLFESVAVAFNLAAGEARADRLDPILDVPEQPVGWLDQEAYNIAYPDSAYIAPEATEGGGDDGTVGGIKEAKDKGLLSYMIFAFVAGLLALATPCVWPMIPITVSFFSKQQGEGGKTSIKGPLAYSLGIITTFTGIGVVMSIIFGASGVQRLAASPWVNGFLALLFVVLALNLFGVYEIVMPQGLVNKFNKKGQSGGLAGPIFMGLAFSLTSFTCTVPFAGTVLAGAANGDYFYPAMGMLAFSLAFALPFFGLALFPQYLARMPKSGTWLTTVKATMGFLELAAAMKFLSNMDLVLDWQFITKPVFLSFWFGIFAVAGFYLMGWLRLPHDVPDVKVGPGRRFSGVISIALGVYWLFAINGAPLGNMSAFVPPSAYGKAEGTSVGGINWVHNIDEALELANEEGKLIFVNFTGWTCSNCRVMEEEIFPTPEVKAEIDKFVAVELYTDRGTPEENANDALRTELTGVSTNPVYVVLNEDREVLSIAQGMQSKEDFIAFLRAGQAKLTASR